MPIAEGGCLCGEVRYEVRSHPTRVTVCHCRFCQRATGAAYHVAAVFDEENFSITRGKTKSYEHISEGSGKRIYIHFCEKCGTKLYLKLERFPGGVGVYGGAFDDPNCFSQTSGVSKQIFLSSARHGTVVPAGVDTYFEHAITADGTPIEPTVFDEPMTIEAGVRGK